MPAAYARTATQALTNVTYRYIEQLADCGLDEACAGNSALLSGINVEDGKIRQKVVAAAHQLPFSS
jgi:alanine dehydrogenase